MRTKGCYKILMIGSLLAFRLIHRVIFQEKKKKTGVVFSFEGLTEGLIIYLPLFLLDKEEIRNQKKFISSYFLGKIFV